MLYRPLRNASDIRLIDLKPKKSTLLGFEVQLQVFKANLQQAPAYQALSYCWGDPNDRVSIGTNGSAFDVTRNLFGALKQIQRDGRVRYLWVDAICINQADVHERTKQVLLMREIYSRSNKVIAWLGEKNENTASGFETMLFFEHCYRYYEELSQVLEWPDGFNPAMDAMFNILRHPYFERIWIVQENKVAKLVTYHCGDLSIMSQTIINACRWLGYVEEDLVSDDSAHECMRLAIEILDDSRSSKGLSLGKLLSRFRGSVATDARDKVYALLGLALHSEDSRPFLPDYTRSVPAVYSKIVKYCIADEQCLGILSDAQGLDRSPDLPSWAADWRDIATRIQIEVRDVAGAPFYHASGHTRPIMDSHCLEISEELVLQGLVCDEVVRVFRGSHQSLALKEDTHAALKDQIAEGIAALGLKSGYPHTSETSKQAFFRTLSADMIIPSEEYFADPTSNIGSSMAPKVPLDVLLFSRRPSPAWVGVYFPNIIHHLRLAQLPPEDSAEDQEMFDANLFSYLNVISEGRVVFSTAKGFIGLGPDDMQSGDIFAIFLGGNVPFVLRPAKDGKYTLVGECYVHGVMDGEAFEKVDGNEFQFIVLV